MAYRGWEFVDPEKFASEGVREQFREAVAGQPAASRKTIRRLEQQLQIDCVAWADAEPFPQWTVRRWPQLAGTVIGDLLHHVPNGGGRSKAEGGIFKAMGVRAGYPDLVLDLPMRQRVTGEWLHGFRCELKAPGEDPRANQVEWRCRLLSVGYFCCTVDSLEGFQAAIFEYLLL